MDEAEALVDQHAEELEPHRRQDSQAQEVPGDGVDIHPRRVREQRVVGHRAAGADLPAEEVETIYLRGPNALVFMSMSVVVFTRPSEAMVISPVTSPARAQTSSRSVNARRP